MVSRWAWGAVLAVGLLLLGVGPGAQAEELGREKALATLLEMPRGRTYSDQEIRAALQNNDRGRDWYENLDDGFRGQLLRYPPERWLAVIICNYQGAPPGSDYARQCEDAYIARQDRATSQWDEHGNFIGVSEACRRANVRTQWGELVCDPALQKPPGS